MDLWIEPWSDGVIVHYYLRADPARKVVTGRELKARAFRAKQIFWQPKDDLEGASSGRPRSTANSTTIRQRTRGPRFYW